MDTRDLALRNLTYALFVELGQAPSAEEVAERACTTEDDVVEGWRRLHDQHAVVLDAATGALRMANPFSAVPDRVPGARGRPLVVRELRLGRVRHLRRAARRRAIEASCPDCGEPLAVEVRDGRADDECLLFHCLVPAAQWWDDIVFT